MVSSKWKIHHYPDSDNNSAMGGMIHNRCPKYMIVVSNQNAEDSLDTATNSIRHAFDNYLSDPIGSSEI